MNEEIKLIKRMLKGRGYEVYECKNGPWHILAVRDGIKLISVRKSTPSQKTLDKLVRHLPSTVSGEIWVYGNGVFKTYSKKGESMVIRYSPDVKKI